MKLGVYLNAQHGGGDDPGKRFSEMLEQVRLLRQHGFDSIWSGEHHITDGFHYYPLVPMLHRLAAEADGMMLGTNILLLPLHNPIEIAETTAFLDVICGGKFLLGVGLGYRAEEFAMFGVPQAERVSRLAEGIEIIRRLWTEDKVTHNGRHWQFENLTIRPQPLQQPRPPILVAAQVEAAIKRAARIADGWAVVPTPRTDEIARQHQMFAEERKAAGLPKAKHVAQIIETCCAPDEEKAIRRAAPFLLTKYAAYMSWGLPGITLDSNATQEQQLAKLAKNRFCIGTPEQVTESLIAQNEAGITHATMRISWPGMKQADILESIELLGTKVLPAVRKRVGTD